MPTIEATAELGAPLYPALEAALATGTDPGSCRRLRVILYIETAT